MAFIRSCLWTYSHPISFVASKKKAPFLQCINEHIWNIYLDMSKYISIHSIIDVYILPLHDSFLMFTYSVYDKQCYLQIPVTFLYYLPTGFYKMFRDIDPFIRIGCPLCVLLPTRTLAASCCLRTP